MTRDCNATYVARPCCTVRAYTKTQLASFPGCRLFSPLQSPPPIPLPAPTPYPLPTPYTHICIRGNEANSYTLCTPFSHGLTAPHMYRPVPTSDLSWVFSMEISSRDHLSPLCEYHLKDMCHAYNIKHTNARPCLRETEHSCPQSWWWKHRYIQT